MWIKSEYRFLLFAIFFSLSLFFIYYPLIGAIVCWNWLCVVLVRLSKKNGFYLLVHIDFALYYFRCFGVSLDMILLSYLLFGIYCTLKVHHFYSFILIELRKFSIVLASIWKIPQTHTVDSVLLEMLIKQLK